MVKFKTLKEILDHLGKGPLLIRKSNFGTQALLASYLLRQEKDMSVVVIFPDNASVEEFVSLLKVFYPNEKKSKWENPWVIFSEANPLNMDWPQVWLNLFSLAENRMKRGIVLSVENLLLFWPSKDVVEEEFLFFASGDELAPSSIIQECINWGYERVELVTQVGEISLRGEVLDVYTACYDFPLRIEFFGDTVESIRLFDPITQRSKSILDDALILPVKPCIFKDFYIKEALNKWDYLWKTGSISKHTKQILEQFLSEQKLNIPPRMFYESCDPLSSFFPDNCVFILVGGDKLRDRLEEVSNKWRSLLENHEIKMPYEFVCQFVNQAREIWIDKKQIVFEDLPVGSDNYVELPERTFYSYQDLLWSGNYKQRPYSTLLSSLKEWFNIYFQVILTFSSEKRRNRFLNLLEGSGIQLNLAYDLNQKGMFALISDFDKGVELLWRDVLVISEKILQISSWKNGKDKVKDFKGIKRIDEIRPGDLIVHRDYGIGRFLRLVQISVDNLGNDFLEIEYANSDKLYLPVDRLNLIQKYKAPDDVVPVLDKLGSNKWALTKEKVRKVLEKVAYDLVRMYAYRKVARGFVYPPSDGLYKEFEATFGFEETPDQERTISEVIRDMESPKLMDRLVCGDAGFGKTEVAIRAAFKAVCAGKQVLMLCPTTVLAEQHYQNFKERMRNFPVSIAMLSRFVPKTDQKKIVEQASEGKIDILIGTHRLLSDDVKLPRLGLFILDEEQRFGVKQKEKIKKMKKNLDVLTLTATPIPRTLQLSLSGIRDLSIIETPPPDRKAVKSFFITREPVRLKEALEKELERGGQVFWVYNRVQGLKEVKELVQSLVPNAKVAMAHGRMSERSLEEIMHKFWKKEVDILVCTSIIESGLDFPNANTIIIDNAHMFGLGQLYQLRGRVGRSNNQGFAYFVVPDKKRLSPLAEKRLQTIMNLDFLGAGFQIAMEDLRMRGAGNLLGEAQTGYITKVGLDMFLDLLNKEIKKAKGESVEEEVDPELNIYIPAHIPEGYIHSNHERLLYYKTLASCNTEKEIEEVIREIKDRFGTLPDPLKNLVEVFRIKRILVKLKCSKADIYPNKTVFFWDHGALYIRIEVLLEWVKQNNKYIKLNSDSKIEVYLDSNGNILHNLSKLRKMLKDLFSMHEKFICEGGTCLNIS